MAVKPGRSEKSGTRYITHTWQLAQGDSGERADLGRYSDKTVQVLGTFDTASVTIEGSMDGQNWAALNGAGGVGELSGLTSATQALLIENPRYVRVPAIGGGASTDVTVIVGASTLVD